MKRILCILLSISLLTGMVFFALAEEDEDIQFSDEELKEMEEEEKEAEEDIEAVVEGEVYHEKTREDFDLNSPAIYTGKMRSDFGGSIWAVKDTSNQKDKLLECKGKKVALDDCAPG